MRAWEFGELICHLNAFSMQSISAVIILSMMLLWLDRMFALRRPSLYRLKATSAIYALLSIFCWGIAICSSCPIATTIMSTKPFPRRLSCMYTDESMKLYTIILLTLCFIIPFVVIFICVISVVCTLYSESKKDQTIKPKYNYTEMIFRTPRLLNESIQIKVSSTLLLFLFILWVPNIIDTHIDQLSVIHEPETADHHDDDCEVPPYFNATNNETEHILKPGKNFIHGIYDVPFYALIFTWFRYVFVVISPLCLLVLKQDLRTKCSNLITSLGSNATPGSAKPRILTPVTTISSARKDSSYSKATKTPKNLVNYNTPVLFATVEGLHIRTPGDSLRSNRSNGWFNFGHKASPEPEFTFIGCDLSVPGEYQETSPSIKTSDEETPKSTLKEKEYAATFPLLKSVKSSAMKHTQRATPPETFYDSDYLSDSHSGSANTQHTEMTECSGRQSDPTKLKKKVSFNSVIREIPRTADTESSRCSSSLQWQVSKANDSLYDSMTYYKQHTPKSLPQSHRRGSDYSDTGQAILNKNEFKSIPARPPAEQSPQYRDIDPSTLEFEVEDLPKPINEAKPKKAKKSSKPSSAKTSSKVHKSVSAKSAKRREFLKSIPVKKSVPLSRKKIGQSQKKVVNSTKPEPRRFRVVEPVARTVPSRYMPLNTSMSSSNGSIFAGRNRGRTTSDLELQSMSTLSKYY